MQRRTLLKLGVGSAAALAVLGAGLALLKPGVEAGRLTPAGREVFAAVAKAVLVDALPPETSARKAAIDAHLARLDATIGGFPKHLQDEIGQLTALLASAGGRIALAGLMDPWASASVDDLQAMLQRLRFSSLELRQQTFHALRELTNATFYADPSAWPAIGYPGPVQV